MIKAKEIKKITPDPYYKISFECSNRRFYEVRNKLWELWEKSGINDDFNNGHYSEECDYEGDLEKIIIYNNEEIIDYIKIVLDYFGGNFDELGNMNLVLSIY